MALSIAVALSSCEQQQLTLDLSNFNMEEVSIEDLGNWPFYGLGRAYKSGGQFCIAEADSTVGAMIVSPKSYTGDVVIRYKTMALTTPTVLVAMLSASDLGAGGTLTLPEDYNGRMGLWTQEKDNYFFAFKNGAHNYPPFIRKYPEPGNDALVIAKENFMLPGVHYDIELGRIGNKLWLTVDGERIIETEEEEMLAGGHIALRVRGTAGLKAACLIKDLVIYSKAP
jgi:hypothetical protein